MHPREILRHRMIEPYVSTLLRSRLVRESGPFAIREFSGVDGERLYTVRENGLKVLIVHRSADVLTLDQAYYQRVYDPPLQVAERLAALRRPLSALDLGANIGMWGLWFHGRFSVARVVALEPDPENSARHRRLINLNGLDDTWQLIEAAATTRGGLVPFTVGQATTGHIATEGQPGTAAVDGKDVFELIDGVDLLKIDIEGAEWPIVADPRFGSIDVPVVMLEHHPAGCPDRVPSEAAAVALEMAGYRTLPAFQEPDGTGIVWGWRSAGAAQPADRCAPRA